MKLRFLSISPLLLSQSQNIRHPWYRNLKGTSYYGVESQNIYLEVRTYKLAVAVELIFSAKLALKSPAIARLTTGMYQALLFNDIFLRFVFSSIRKYSNLFEI